MSVTKEEVTRLMTDVFSEATPEAAEKAKEAFKGFDFHNAMDILIDAYCAFAKVVMDEIDELVKEEQEKKSDT